MAANASGFLLQKMKSYGEYWALAVNYFAVITNRIAVAEICYQSLIQIKYIYLYIKERKKIWEMYREFFADLLSLLLLVRETVGEKRREILTSTVPCRDGKKISYRADVKLNEIDQNINSYWNIRFKKKKEKRNERRIKNGIKLNWVWRNICDLRFDSWAIG